MCMCINYVMNINNYSFFPFLPRCPRASSLFQKHGQMLAHRGKAFFARAHLGVGLPPHSRLPVNTSKFMVRDHLSISFFTFMSYIAPLRGGLRSIFFRGWRDGNPSPCDCDVLLSWYSDSIIVLLCVLNHFYEPTPPLSGRFAVES